jgi:predicted ATPase/DNA-binding SARP family transcriptional activator
MVDVSQSASSSAPLVIRLFGAFDVKRNDCTLAPTRSRKEQWLLALLLLRRHTVLERHWLAGVLWPDSEETWALQNLRRSLSNLRSVLGEDAYRLTAPSPRTLQFDVTGACIDLCDFDAAVAAAAARHSREEVLRRVVELYRGPLLEGCMEEWLLPERASREHEFLQAVESLAAASKPVEAMRLLRKALFVEPARETALRALLRALATSGDQAGMTEAYRNFCSYLSRELNTSPDPQTTELYRQLRRQARENPQPYAQAQMISANRHLPCPATRLIGREVELREIIDLLGKSRLLTLTGTGGIGKTRLAIAVAEAIADDFTDGAWFVDLASVEDRSHVADTIALALHVPAESNRSLLDTLAAHLRQRTLLLILDNCEHLSDECASLASALLNRCPQLRLLATSRQPLGVIGEQAWRVSALSLPENGAEHVPNEASLAQTPLRERTPVSDSELLFQDRATAVLPSFRLTVENRPDVAEVCRLVEGVPFAIELAASWVRVLPVSQIASRLQLRFDFLKNESKDVLSRHQTLRATLDWSYRLLSPQEQAMLRRLSVFIGGWALDAAEAVCGDEEIDPDTVLELLAALVDKSLVTYEDRDGDARYHLLEAARQYAREKLSASGEASDLERRHRTYFLALAEAYHVPFMDVERSHQYRRMEREGDNFRRALEGCCTASGDAETGLRLAGALCPFWTVRGYAQEERRLLLLLLQGSAEPDPVRTKALYGAGQLAFNQDDRPAALALFRQALRLAQDLDYSDLEARTLYYLGILARDGNEYPEAHTLLAQSLALFRRQGNRQAVAVVLGSLGNLARKQEDWSQAEALFAESLSICEREADRNGVAYIFFSKGLMARQQGDSERALGWFEHSLRIWQQSEHSWGQSAAQYHLGLLACERGDYSRAYAQLAQSLLLRQQRGDRAGIVESLETFAELAATLGRFQQAAMLLGAACGVREDIAALDTIAESSNPGIRDRLAASLGTDTFSAAFASGRTMTSEELKALFQSLDMTCAND